MKDDVDTRNVDTNDTNRSKLRSADVLTTCYHSSEWVRSMLFLYWNDEKLKGFLRRFDQNGKIGRRTTLKWKNPKNIQFLFPSASSDKIIDAVLLLVGKWHWQLTLFTSHNNKNRTSRLTLHNFLKAISYFNRIISFENGRRNGSRLHQLFSWTQFSQRGKFAPLELEQFHINTVHLPAITFHKRSNRYARILMKY